MPFQLVGTEAEVEKLIKAARAGRHGYRDATLILIAFRHGLRAVSACTLIWLSGRHSIIQRYTPLCFHEAFDNRTGQSDEDANSYIVEHLKSVGLTARQAWLLVQAAPPSNARCATEWWATELGFTPQIVTNILGGNRACQAKFCLSVP